MPGGEIYLEKLSVQTYRVFDSCARLQGYWNTDKKLFSSDQCWLSLDELKSLVEEIDAIEKGKLS